MGVTRCLAYSLGLSPCNFNIFGHIFMSDACLHTGYSDLCISGTPVQMPMVFEYTHLWSSLILDSVSPMFVLDPWLGFICVYTWSLTQFHLHLSLILDLVSPAFIFDPWLGFTCVYPWSLTWFHLRSSLILNSVSPAFILDLWLSFTCVHAWSLTRFKLNVLDSIKMYLREERHEDVDWCYLPEDRVYL
jgi:hypothetical protein